MNPSDELRRHAMECGQIAHSLRNKENRVHGIALQKDIFAVPNRMTPAVPRGIA
jgi:hypothetical protein